VETGGGFAAHAALAWDHPKEVDGLQAAMASHELIGQAQGVLMNAHKLTADAAFALMRAASQHRNVKLRVIAQHVVDTGTLPDET